MLYRKITSYIEDYLKSDTDKILILEGARQIGKSFSIREVGMRLFPNYVEINFVEDDEGEQLFKNIHKKEDFYLLGISCRAVTIRWCFSMRFSTTRSILLC